MNIFRHMKFTVAVLWLSISTITFMTTGVLCDINYYNTLNLQPHSAGTAQIKKAYKKLAKKYHPDRNPGDEKAND